MKKLQIFVLLALIFMCFGENLISSNNKKIRDTNSYTSKHLKKIPESDKEGNLKALYEISMEAKNKLKRFFPDSSIRTLNSGDTSEETSEQTNESTSESTTENTSESTTESTSETTTENTSESTTEDTSETTTEDTSETTTEDTSESTTENTSESTTEDTSESTT